MIIIPGMFSFDLCNSIVPRITNDPAIGFFPADQRMMTLLKSNSVPVKSGKSLIGMFLL